MLSIRRRQRPVKRRRGSFPRRPTVSTCRARSTAWTTCPFPLRPALSIVLSQRPDGPRRHREARPVESVLAAKNFSELRGNSWLSLKIKQRHRLRSRQRHRRRRSATSGSRTARSSPRRPIRTSLPDQVPSTPPAWSSCPAASTCTRHIAGPKVNVARKMRPEDKRRADPVRRTPLTRSGTIGSVPSTFATGYLYAGMGYTTAFDAAIPPLGARHAHEEFHDTPIIDKGFYVLIGNNHYVLQADRRQGKPERLQAFVGLAARTRPRATPSSWSTPAASRSGSRRADNVHGLDDDVESLRRHAAADHRRARPGGDGPRLAAPRPHPLQQPRHARQLEDHAGHDGGARRPPRPPHAHPVPQLRRRRRTTRARSARSVPSWPTTSTPTATSRSTSARCCSAKRPR